MSNKPGRHHHFVPQFYLRNFAQNEQLRVFNTAEAKLFSSNPRNIAGERDLYRLEGPEPHLAEEMFGEIEAALSPIINNIIQTESLPNVDSDDFLSLLSFIATMIIRHPRQLNSTERFTAELASKTVAIAASQNKPFPLQDGRIITIKDFQETIEASNQGKIKVHVPKDHSISSSLKSLENLTGLLMQRNWGLGVAEGGSFITSTNPVLLCWKQLDLHDHHSPGFGIKDTAVYFPVSPKLIIIGEFNQIKNKFTFDARDVAALNGLHGIYSPEFLIASEDSSEMQLGSMGTQKFQELPKVFKRMQSSNDE